jgi:Cu/Ag efflux protein CusF
VIYRRTLLLGLVLLAGCAKQAPEKRYTLTGDVLGVDPKSQMATIKGDKIEGWMEAMTMEYPVKDKAEFSKLTVGDRISATVFVGEANYRLSDIKVTGKAGAQK